MLGCKALIQAAPHHLMREMVNKSENESVCECHRYLLGSRRERDENTGRQNEEKRSDVEGHKPVHFIFLAKILKTT
jgi:hypothetical protein